MPIRKKDLRRVRVKARIASKVREKDLIEKAKALMDDPELILPECALECGGCPFKKTRKHLAKVSKHKDNPDKLAKLAYRGDRLARAYAATVGLAHDEKAPYLASATYPGGTIMFALRGRTDREKLIGVQNYDSPKWRVLSVIDLVKKRGLHFYSYGDAFICTGRSPEPPEEYIEQAAQSVGANRPEGEGYHCPHNPLQTEHIVYSFRGADRKVVLCNACAFKAKNTLAKLSEGMAVPRITDETNVSVVRPLRKVAGKADCQGLLDMPVSAKLMEEYAKGQVGDRELVDKHMEEVKANLEQTARKLYILGDKCFGEDLGAFVKELGGDEVETKALEGMLSKIDRPVVAESGDTVNRILSTYWSEHGLDALEAVVPEKVAEKHFRDDDESKKSPMRVIRQALKETEHAEVASRIPTYAGLSAYGKFVDAVARAYKTRGAQGAIAVLDAEKSGDHRIRSISHAFYLALGVTTKSWKFTTEEKEFGSHLERTARRLLESGSQDGHHQAFAEFLRDAGSTEELKRV